MKLPDCPFTVIDWADVPATEHPGETGKALWRTKMLGQIRIRQVEYLPGYLSNVHHLIITCNPDGELATELSDGRDHHLTKGMSFLVSDFGDPPHRTRTTSGATVFIVD